MNIKKMFYFKTKDLEKCIDPKLEKLRKDWSNVVFTLNDVAIFLTSKGLSPEVVAYYVLGMLDQKRYKILTKKTKATMSKYPQYAKGLSIVMAQSAQAVNAWGDMGNKLDVEAKKLADILIDTYMLPDLKKLYSKVMGYK